MRILLQNFAVLARDGDGSVARLNTLALAAATQPFHSAEAALVRRPMTDVGQCRQ